MQFLTLTNYACTRISWNSQRLTGMLLGEVEWGRKQEARESKTGVALFTPSELEITTYFFFTVLHHWQTVNIWLSCWGANFWSTLTTSHFYWPCLPFLKHLSAVIPLFRSPPAVFSSGVSQDLRFGWSGSCHNEGDGDIWADRCGGALQGRVDCSGSHPASHTEIQKAPGAGEPY